MSAGDRKLPADGPRGETAGACPSRRGFLKAAGGVAALAGAGLGGAGLGAAAARAGTGDAHATSMRASEPFYGAHQAGISTPQQTHTYFTALDLAAAKRDELVATLKIWTEAAARMTKGETARPMGSDTKIAAPDDGTALGLSPARLTLTFGFGPGLFQKDGKDRYGLAHLRPAALVDLPRFNGDQLVVTRTGGDLSIQACADDPQVAFHAVRELVRIAYGAAEMRWAQSGFLPGARKSDTPRNLMGFKDGTQQPASLEKAVWVGAEGPDWMRGGSYLVARRIRMALEHWDRTDVDFQEQTMGRHKYSGAPLGMTHERDALDLERTDKDGNPVIPDSAHVRLAAPATNGGAEILRRGYSYNDGVDFTAERWPPWRQGMEYDAGLLFLCYQKDPRTGFIKIFERMSKLDMLNQFTTHVGGGIFACPGGVAPGRYIGQGLIESA
ncbi:MAG TPA: iron uptake transporter deferrochelatase/peroxidase subunit [Alphaproteobacteria bacterium]|nr:iron uptake transporter deferrochelatase/peroxidase subunit [Alphaproteobacteria bacterium]